MNTTRTLAFALGLLAAGSGLVAQNYAYLPASLNPNGNELANYSLRPFMQPDSKVQMFFDATEVGSNSLTIDELTLRWDGPLPQVGAPGPFAIQRLRINVGVSSVATPGATFAANLSAPLTTVFDSPWSYLPDPGVVGFHAWGEPGNALKFPFTTPVSVVVPPNSWLVVELVMEGNNIASFGFSHALVDAARATGGPVDGVVTNYGTGCSAPQASAAVIGSTGVHAPGAAHFVNGQNLGANAPVFLMLGLSDVSSQLGALPLALPGTNCTILQSIDTYRLLTANASGAIPNNSQAAAVVVPPTSVLNGVVFHEQLLSVVAGANSPWDFVLSDARRVQLGTLTQPSRGTWTVSHGSLANPTVADRVEALGLAVRLRTL
ncbi:MAG: hypothetical protein RL148_3034 [Planctomycetota bacterium]|jgi:hypothetical protein